MKRIHITTGDPNGIGLEIALKSLIDKPVEKNIQFILWRSPESSPSLKPLLEKVYKKFQTSSVNQFEESSSSLLDIQSDVHPAMWVKKSALLCLENPSHCLVTAPLSKTLIQTHPECSSFRGHTDLLKSVSSSKGVMCFLGEKFNVVLLTDHIPLKNISLDRAQINVVVDLILKKSLALGFSNKPIGLLGLNPHAGEEGLLGKEETQILSSIVKQHPSSVEGPLVPDVAFQENFWNKYSCYLCLYHDQGLIPFKMIHKNQGVHVTLGLPFVRTSVDHGTAKDIFGQNKANSSSMSKAIQKAITLMG